MFDWDNEREDIQIAHDRAQAQARENYWNNFNKNIVPDYQYTNEQIEIKLSQIVKEMIESNQSKRLYFKEQIYFDMDVHDSVENACIQLGLSTEDYCPELHDKGDQIEIYI